MEESDVRVTPTVDLAKVEKEASYAWGLDENVTGNRLLELGFTFLLG